MSDETDTVVLHVGKQDLASLINAVEMKLLEEPHGSENLVGLLRYMKIVQQIGFKQEAQ